MPTPIVETIISDVISALEGVTEQAGYNNTILWAGRLNRLDPERGPVELKPYAFVYYLGESGNEPGNSSIQIFPSIAVRAVVDANINDSLSPDEKTTLIGFDCLRAIIAALYSTERDYFLTGYNMDSLQALSDKETEDGVLITLNWRAVAEAPDIWVPTA